MMSFYQYQGLREIENFGGIEFNKLARANAPISPCIAPKAAKKDLGSSSLGLNNINCLKSLVLTRSQIDV